MIKKQVSWAHLEIALIIWKYKQANHVKIV